MSIIHLVDGEKGGVGKSLFCRVLIEYFWKQGRNSHNLGLVDADKNFPLLGQTYAPEIYSANDNQNDNISLKWAEVLSREKFKWLYFSEFDEIMYEFDDLFEIAAEYPIIINLPSNVYSQVKKWIEGGDLLEVGKQINVSFWKWFITTGEEESRAFLKTSLQELEKIEHIIVKNEGINTMHNWSSFNQDTELQKIIKRNKARQIVLPKLQLPKNKYDQIKQSCTTFAQFVDPASGNPRVQQSRVYRFLEQCWQQLDEIGIPESQIDTGVVNV